MTVALERVNRGGQVITKKNHGGRQRCEAVNYAVNCTVLPFDFVETADKFFVNLVITAK